MTKEYKEVKKPYEEVLKERQCGGRKQAAKMKGRLLVEWIKDLGIDFTGV